MELRDRSALVTGGAGGLGAATVRRLVDEGMAVVVFDQNADGAAALAAELGDRVRAVGGQVTDDADVGSAVDAATALAPLSVVVNVAGGATIAGRTIGREPLGDGRANAARSAGDERCLALQGHEYSPKIWPAITAWCAVGRPANGSTLR